MPPKINRTYCSVYGCLNNNIKNSEYSFFSIPTKPELRMRWLQVMNRMDLVDGYRYHRVCEEHFEPEDILVKATRRLLKKNVVPSVRLPVVGLEFLPHIPETEMESSEEIEEIKQEIEDAFSEHEDDIIEAMENRKRKNETDPVAGFSKKIKEENQESQEVITIDIDPIEYNEIPGKQKSDEFSSRSKPEVLTVEVNRENDVFPVDFMKSVLNSQQEILTVLKSHVLLEHPDPGLLTFLRLVGAKLSRLNPLQRKLMQNVILDVIDKK